MVAEEEVPEQELLIPATVVLAVALAFMGKALVGLVDFQWVLAAIPVLAAQGVPMALAELAGLMAAVLVAVKAQLALAVAARFVLSGPEASVYSPPLAWDFLKFSRSTYESLHRNRKRSNQEPPCF